jgi:hypothetical protein
VAHGGGRNHLVFLQRKKKKKEGVERKESEAMLWSRTRR